MSDDVPHDAAKLSELPADELERALGELVGEGAEAVPLLQELERRLRVRTTANLASNPPS